VDIQRPPRRHIIGIAEEVGETNPEGRHEELYSNERRRRYLVPCRDENRRRVATRLLSVISQIMARDGRIIEKAIAPQCGPLMHQAGDQREKAPRLANPDARRRVSGHTGLEHAAYK